MSTIIDRFPACEDARPPLIRCRSYNFFILTPIGRCRFCCLFFKTVRAALALATSISELIRKSDPPRRKKNSHRHARRDAMKMDRQLPDRRPILIATKAMLFIGQDTSSGLPYPSARCRHGIPC